ncbi:MAG: class I SAM-dependent methyltransferase, partial [Deltaproteobacteria bacterium]|nr:class I SAM-dependent methyltransferase [Deltaproteobacteria bacterium]MBW2537243.1 class I SAM-dependent methyltransferase [Deltaproteobacteria bacterium]
MASETTSSLPLHPTRVLGAFCEALAAGKRVAVVGDSSTGLAASLAPSAGRRLYAFDPDPRRTAENVARSPQRGASRVSYVVLDDDLDAHAGAFDLVVIPDLAEHGEPETILRQACGLLCRRGVVVVASPNPRAVGVSGGLGYYELYDALAGEMETVQTLGQAAFVGFTIADFAAEGDPAVTIDSSLCEASEEPHWFVLVGSQGPVEVDPYTLIQVPTAAGLGWLTTSAPVADEPADEVELVQARQQLADMTAEIDELREQRRR